MKWIVRLLDTTVDELHAWSSIQQTITFFCLVIRLVLTISYSYPLSSSIIVWEWDCSIIDTSFFLVSYKRKDSLEFGILKRCTKRQFMGIYTVAYLTMWSELLLFANLTIIYLIAYLNGKEPLKCLVPNSESWLFFKYMQVQSKKWWNSIWGIFGWNRKLHWLGDWNIIIVDEP